MSSRCPARRVVVAIAVWAGLGRTSAQPPPTDQWNSLSSGNWSVGTNWLGGTAPPAGGDPSRVLFFPIRFVPSTSYTATNNLPGEFSLRGIRFAGSQFGVVEVAAFGGSSLRFAAPDSFVTMDGWLAAGITSPATLTGLLTLGGSGLGSLGLTNTLSGGPGAGLDALRIDATGASNFPSLGLYDGGSVDLLGANAFAGNTTLANGNLTLGNSSALGVASNELTVTGANATVRFSGNAANPVTANVTLRVGGSSQGPISGPGGLTTVGGLSYSGNGTFTGATTAGTPGIASTNNLTLTGNGVLAATSGVTVYSGTTLALVNSGTNLTNRVADVPLALHDARLNFTAATNNAASAESFGNLTLSGHSILTPAASTVAGSSSVLNFGSLSRTDNATLFVRTAVNNSQVIGGGPPAANRTNVHFAGGLPIISDPLGPVGGQNTGVVPFVAGSLSGNSSSSASTLSTYDANGLQLLRVDDAAVFNQVTNGSPALLAHTNNNVRSTAPVVTGTVVVNALAVSTNGAITGGGTIRVGSGAVLSSFSSTINGPTLDFGTAPGYLLGGSVTVQGASRITGTAGVTYASANNQVLNLSASGANDFSGGLFVNGAASVAFATDNQLGAAGQPVTLNGGRLEYAGTATGATAAGRPVRLGPAGGRFAATAPGGTLQVGGPVTGPGGLTATQGTVVLSGPLSYDGPTKVAGGTLVINGPHSGTGTTWVDLPGRVLQVNGDINLPAGPVVLTGGTLRITNGGTVSRDVFAIQSSFNGLDVPAGGTATLAGAIRGTESISKTGGGTLVLTADSPTPNYVVVEAGTLALTGGGRLASLDRLQADALVRLDYAAGTVDRLSDAGQLTGNVRIDGGAAPATETVGRYGSGTVTIIPNGATTTLHAVTSTGTNSLFRGPNLGGSVGVASRVTFGDVPDGTVLVMSLADNDPNGVGTEQAVYKTGTGVRPAVASDYVTGLVLQNATGTPTTADFRVVGTVPTVDAANTVRSLRMEPGSTLNAGSGTLTLGASYVFAAPGGSSAITGGTVAATNFMTLGDLTVSSNLTADRLTKSGPGTLTLNGPVSGGTGALNVRAGRLVLNNGAVNTFGAIGGTGEVLSGEIVLNTAATVLRVTGATFPVYNPISGPGRIVYDSQGPSYLSFAGPNTFSGGVSGNAAARYAFDHPQGFGTGPLTLANTGTATEPNVLFGGNNNTIANEIRLSAAATSTLFQLTDTSPGVVLAGRITGGSATPGTVLDLRATGRPEGITLTNLTNDFMAPTVRVNSSTLTIAGDGALGNPANALLFSGGNESRLRLAGSNIVIARPLTVSAVSAIETLGNRAEYAGVIGGTEFLRKTGAGTLRLSAVNTATGGLAVDGGTLELTGSFPANGVIPVVVRAGATLSGTGTLADGVEVQSGGRLAPGVETATGRLTVAGLNMLTATGATFAVRLNGSLPGDGTSPGGYDQLAITAGTAELLGATLSATVGAGFDPTVANAPLFIIDKRSAGNAVPFASLPNNALVALGAFTAQISYFGDFATLSTTGGNDVVLYNFQPVPEPASCLVIAATAAGAVMCFRRHLRRRRPLQGAP